ncbi:MAG: internal scaffolding protein [Arizlama microvirus]|nr:MAG: internal scaffolding protein [Arizlama microvirus]
MKRISVSPYLYDPLPGKDFPADDKNSRSMTQQHFAGDTDINAIVAKFVKTGSLDPSLVNQRAAVFADVSGIVDYRTTLDRIRAVNEQFELLPVEIRARFENDASNLLEFVANPANAEEAVKLGLLPKPVSELPVELKPVVPETPKPAV